MTLTELRRRYNDTISLAECFLEDITPDVIQTGGVIPDALGIGIFRLDDGIYLIPYFVSNSLEGYERFDLELARESTPKLAERLLREIYQSILYHQYLQEEVRGLIEPAQAS